MEGGEAADGYGPIIGPFHVFGGDGGVSFLVAPFQIPAQLPLPFHSTSGLGLIFIALIAVYLGASGAVRGTLTFRKQPLKLPSFNIALGQIAVSSLDWGLAAATLYCLLPAASLTYLVFLKIYLLAMAAGVLSNVPGGVGVFETVVIVLLSAQLSPAAVLAALLAYRGVYYFLPLMGAIVLLGLHEMCQQIRGNHQL